MGISDESRRLADTREFLAMWSAAKEEHFAQELVPILPLLLGSSANLDAARVQEAAHHLVRAMHLATEPDAGLPAALEYLNQVTTATRHPSAG
jgi:hypothetical protein